MPPSDPARDRDPGLAAERTRMAWTRTALAFAAVGAVILRTSVPAGLVVLTVCPLIWVLGRLAGPGRAAEPGPDLGVDQSVDQSVDQGVGGGVGHGAGHGAGRGAMSPARRCQLVTITIIVVALVALGVSIFAHGR